MLTYECSVCKSQLNSKSEWLEHLIQENHLSLARRGMLSWSEAVRVRVIVVFAKLPIGQDVKVIQKLSTDGETIVTDFVWWEERPRVGFVQFDSRETLTKVLASLQDERFQIDEQLCQVMDGGSIAEAEWRTLFPGRSETSQVTPQPEAHASNKPSNGHGHTGGTPPKLVKLENTEQKQEGLRHHLSSIMTSVLIPDEEYNTAVDITQTLQQALHNYGGPSIKTFLCRHWVLKLQYCPNSNLKNVGCGIAVHCSNDPTVPSNAQSVKEKMMNFFNSKQNLQNFPHYLVKEVAPDRKIGMGKPGQRAKSRRYSFTSRSTPEKQFFMTILFKKDFPAESQIWYLATYLSTFDPRCYPVLSSIFYWAKVNSVTFGKNYMKGFGENLGDPCGLTWLVLFFFQREGLIPSTKEVLERPHEPSFYGEIDVGFSHSPEFATAWKRIKNTEGMDEATEEFSKEVFTLLYKFFWFCHSQLGQATKGRGLILNTRDVEMISVVELMAGAVQNSKLSSAELTEIRNSLGKGKSLEMEITVMLNPLVSKWKISTSSAGKAYPAMKKTALKMRSYFGEGNGNGGILGLEEFLDLLKI